eukprot:287213-Prorocentrum_minimum.AAC.7
MAAALTARDRIGCFPGGLTGRFRPCSFASTTRTTVQSTSRRTPSTPSARTTSCPMASIRRCASRRPRPLPKCAAEYNTRACHTSCMRASHKLSTGFGLLRSTDLIRKSLQA